MRSKKCKVCRAEFVPRSTLQKVCSIDCAKVYANDVRRRQERRDYRVRKERLKTRSDYIKDAQVAFNSFIRERDKDRPCICCGRPLASEGLGGGFDCGHYRSVGSAPHLRFDEQNAHGQRKQCNRWGSGRAVDYRVGLIERIGLEAVERLESDQTVQKWTIDDLKSIRDKYRAMLRELKKRSI